MTKEKSEILQKSRQKLGHVIFGRSLVMLLGLALNVTVMLLFMTSWLQDLPLLFGGTAAFTGAILLYILNAPGDPSVKLSWCFIVAVLPLFGTVLYFFTRWELGHRTSKRILQKTVKQSVKYFADTSALTDALPPEDAPIRNLTHYLRHSSCGQLYGNTKVTYFPLGEDKFTEMLRQLEKAEKFIFLEYFAIAPSYMWDTISEVLTRKAAQGIEVRLIYDGGCSISYLPPNYPKQLQKLGIQCKVFSPFRPFVSTHYNNRDHRKICVVDGHTAFTGGVNLLDRYINKKEVYGHWKDTAVMLQGDAAREFTLMFLQMWNNLEKEPVYEPYLRDVSTVNTEQGYVIPYWDSPLDQERVGEMVYLDIIGRAQKYLYIMTPYLILDGELLTALTFAARRGVDVRIILPHIPDKKYAFALARSHYKDLVNAGVKVYEYTPGFIHAKVFLSDDTQAVVGTINLDYRSLYHHFECAAFLYKVPALTDIMEDFQNTLAVSHRVTREDIKNQSLFYRITGFILKLIAPLM